MRLTDFHNKLLAAALLALPLSVTACADDVTGGDSGDDSTGGTTEDPTNPTSPSTTLTTTTDPGTSTTMDPTAADSSSSGDPTDTETTDPGTTTTTTDPGTSSSTGPGDESSSSTTGSPAECGDGVLNGDEECDGEDFGDATCPIVGELACNDDCTLDLTGCTDTLVLCNTPAAPLDGTTPPDMPFVDVINITDDVFVTDLNVTVDINHVWVGDLVNLVVSPDPDVGSVLVNQPCGQAADINARFDDDGVEPVCADMPALSGDILPVTELRDLIGISSAGDWTFAAWDAFPTSDDGVLNEWCLEFTLSDTDPVVCGDDEANYGEACDGMDLNGLADCTGLPGFISGDISCAGDCTYDTSACVAACGNGEIDLDFAEVCDGDNLDGLTCDDLPGFNGGTLACADDCGSFDTTMCDASCGNDLIDDETEQCDGTDLGGLTCDDFFGLTGAGLACDDMCGLDFTGCMDSGAFETCSAPAAFITTGTPVVDTLNVADMGNVADLNVTVDITHTWAGDLEITVEGPSGTSALLVDNECGSDDNVNAIFDDEGVALDCDFPVVDSSVSGTILPAAPLTAFDGAAYNGDWTLTVTDTAAGDDGTLNEWCVQITPE